MLVSHILENIVFIHTITDYTFIENLDHTPDFVMKGANNFLMQPLGEQLHERRVLSAALLNYKYILYLFC